MAGALTAAELEAYFHDKIPVTKLMRISVKACEPGRLILSAPLEVNHNQLGTAFGGSMATLLTLAGYGALWVALGDPNAHVVVRKGEIDYRQPVEGDIEALCELPEEGVCDDFCRTFRSKGKARIVLGATIRSRGKDCAIYRGEFVALR